MDSLSHYKHMALDDDTLSRYLSSVQVWPKDKWSVWQGYYFCSADFPDSGTTVIIFSSHGGFFYDIKHKQYYCVTDDLRDSFTAYFINKLKAYYGKGN